MKQLLKVALVITGGVICTHSAVAQTKAIEVTSGGNMRFYGHQDIRFGDNENWGIEYYNGGLNFFKKNADGTWGENQLFLKDNGNVGIGTANPWNNLHIVSKVKDWGTAMRIEVNEVNSIAYTLTRGGVDQFYVTGDGLVCSKRGTYDYSDSKLKKDIEPVSNALGNIMKMRGVSYKFIDDSSFHDSRTSTKQANAFAATMNKEHAERKHIGFVAQEIEAIYPDAVRTMHDGLKAINYSALIPVLVEALKEQQSQITALSVKEQSNAQLMLRMEQLEKQLAQCCPANTAPGKGKLKSSSTEAETTATTSALSTSIVLYQNTPNPFSTSTEISMELPKDVQDAQLAVYNLAGEQRLSIAVTERGTATVRIEAGQLKPGIYIYGIIADGQLAASKQMVVTE